MTEESDSPSPYQFPFLPSYDMAVNEMRATQQSFNDMSENPRDDIRETNVQV